MQSSISFITVSCYLSVLCFFTRDKFSKINREIILFFVFCFIISYILLFFLKNRNKPKVFSSYIYANIFICIVTSLKIIFTIILNCINDFIMVSKNNIKKISDISSTGKILNILYANHIYFYIFFLIQLIVVLTIECVIT